MKKTLLVLALLGLLSPVVPSASAGTPQQVVIDETKSEEEPTPLNVVELDTSYTFSSKVRFAGEKRGSGAAMHNYFEYVRRIPISGNWYFQIGATYDRFDFGGSATAFLPTTLQSFNFPIGISYIQDGYVGFLAQVRPGLNFEHRITSGAFDIPFEMGSFIPIVDQKFYITWGVGTSILREWPVIPMVGIVWVINDQFRIMGYAPEPKVIYQPNEQWQFWVGGEFLSGSYKVGRRSNSRLSHTVVDYSEYRVGTGVTYEPKDNWEISLVGGYAVYREFDFHRANRTYPADPAPYIRFQLSAAF